MGFALLPVLLVPLFVLLLILSRTISFFYSLFCAISNLRESECFGGLV